MLRFDFPLSATSMYDFNSIEDIVLRKILYDIFKELHVHNKPEIRI